MLSQVTSLPKTFKITMPTEKTGKEQTNSNVYYTRDLQGFPYTFSPIYPSILLSSLFVMLSSAMGKLRLRDWGDTCPMSHYWKALVKTWTHVPWITITIPQNPRCLISIFTELAQLIVWLIGHLWRSIDLKIGSMCTRTLGFKKAMPCCLRYEEKCSQRSVCCGKQAATASSLHAPNCWEHIQEVW